MKPDSSKTIHTHSELCQRRPPPASRAVWMLQDRPRLGPPGLWLLGAAPPALLFSFKFAFSFFGRLAPAPACLSLLTHSPFLFFVGNPAKARGAWPSPSNAAAHAGVAPSSGAQGPTPPSEKQQKGYKDNLLTISHRPPSRSF